MANTVNLTDIFLKLIDASYKVESKTAMLDAITQTPNFVGTNEVQVMKLSAVGLGTYSRTDGYPAGNITATWETITLAAERGREFTLDRMDDEEMLGLVLGNLIREWMRLYVAPEIDAYRFAKYCTNAGNEVGNPMTLSSSTVLDAIDVATAQMNADEVPEEGRKLFVSDAVQTYLDAAVTRMYGNEAQISTRVKNYNMMDVIMVPQTRFYKAISLDAGATGGAGGFSDNGADINFLMVHPSAVLQPTKLNQVKYFSPDVWQGGDFHAWQYRLYHDAFVYENKEDGVYAHVQAS